MEDDGDTVGDQEERERARDGISSFPVSKLSLIGDWVTRSDTLGMCSVKKKPPPLPTDLRILHIEIDPLHQFSSTLQRKGAWLFGHSDCCFTITRGTHARVCMEPRAACLFM